jgi:hypothetical protein
MGPQGLAQGGRRVIHFHLRSARDRSTTAYDTAGTEAGLDRRLITAVAVLIGVGGLLGFAGMAVGGGAILAAGRRWMRRKDVHPRDLAAQTWRQTLDASCAGAQAWRASAPSASR